MTPDSRNLVEDIQNHVTTIVLAGGRARRFKGQDKGLIAFKGKPLLKHAIDTFSPHTHALVISANRNIKLYEQYGFPVIQDKSPDYLGPLAGVAASLDAVQTRFAFVVACDMPTLPASVIQRLYSALITKQCDLALAHDGTRGQPLCMVLNTQLKPSLTLAVSRQALKVLRWINTQNHTLVDCSDIKETFQNINTFCDLKSH